MYRAGSGVHIHAIDPSYVVTVDNLLKMLSIQMRMKNNLPVVIMGIPLPANLPALPLFLSLAPSCLSCSHLHRFFASPLYKQHQFSTTNTLAHTRAGETGCGKSSLITQLCAIIRAPLRTLNIHGGMEDQDVIDWYTAHARC